MTAGARLLSYWKGQPISIRPPVNDEILRDFEGSYGITLLEDVRDYYEHSDGFAQVFESETKRYWDKQGFNFYPLSKVVPVDSIYDGDCSFPGSNDYYVFADYLDWCWGYAVRLAPNASTVVIIGKRDKPVLVAETFNKFVDLYIANHDAIYGGSGLVDST